MEETSNPYPAQLIAGLITIFGSSITLLLGICAFFLKRYINNLDDRIEAIETGLDKLRDGLNKHTGELQNIRHRMKK